MQRSFQGVIGRNVVELRRVRLNRAFLKLNRLLTDDRRALPDARGSSAATILEFANNPLRVLARTGVVW